MTVGFEALGIFPELIRRNEENLVLDGTRAQQRFPVRFSSVSSKRRWNEDQISLAACLLAIELGKSKIVTNAQAHVAELRFGDYYRVASGTGVGFPRGN